MLEYEDFTVGREFVSRSHAVSAKEITDFAHLWDPQGIHVDPQFAAASSFGGLVASGVHSWAIVQRLAVDTVLNQANTLCSPGYESVRFLRPVVPESELHGRFTVIEAARSANNPALAKVKLRYELVHSDGQLMLDGVVWVLFKRTCIGAGREAQLTGEG